MPEDTTPNPANMPATKPAADPAPSTLDPDTPFEALPKHWQDEIRRARQDATKYRQRAKLAADDEWYDRATNALAELDNAGKTTAQQLTEQLNQSQQAETESRLALDRLRAAVRAGFHGAEADDIAARLRGDTAEELEADAKALRERFPAKQAGLQPDPSQGSALPLNGDPLAALLRSKLA